MIQSRGSVIEQVMDEFDFEKLHKVMELVGWKWFDPQKGAHIPTIGDLKKSARQRLNNLEGDNNCYSSSCGGFTARMIEGDARGGKRYELFFTIEKSCGFFEGEK